jgi:hypothetical protein
MQALKLTIEGEYWDSQIYSGRLYLFHVDGSVATIDWERMVSEWNVDPDLRIALLCAFSHSDYLYGRQLRVLFGDPEIKQVIQRKFERLKEVELTADQIVLTRYRTSMQDSPFPFPHSDCHVYRRRFYVSSQRGITSSGCGQQSKHGISPRSATLWDCPVLSIAMYSNTIAMAAGEEGLLEQRIAETPWRYSDESGEKPWKEPRTIADKHCESCDWTEYSVYGSSHTNDGFLAYFSTNNGTGRKSGKEIARYAAPEFGIQPLPKGSEPSFKRTFEGLFTAVQIFHSSGYSWASRDKIYQATNGQIRVKRFQPGEYRASKEPYSELGTLVNYSKLGDVVSAGVAVFGTVIEYDKGVVVILSDESQTTMLGEPVRWRIFPRSKYYENQLHLIQDDRLEIWSFNHDYFVNQSTKLSGVSHSPLEDQRAISP